MADFDFDHHTVDDCRAAWGTTCWVCDPEHHPRPVAAFQTTVDRLDPDLVRLLFGDLPEEP